MRRGFVMDYNKLFESRSLNDMFKIRDCLKQLCFFGFPLHNEFFYVEKELENRYLDNVLNVCR